MENISKTVLPVIKKQAHRRSILSKYERELMIIAIAEMILTSKPRSEIIDEVHVTYGYSINTIKDLLTEANVVAAKSFDPEHIKTVANIIDSLYAGIIGKPDEFVMWKLKAADQWAKLHGLYKPDSLIQVNINQGLSEKLKVLTVNQLEDIIEAIEPLDNEK